MKISPILKYQEKTRPSRDRPSTQGTGRGTYTTLFTLVAPQGKCLRNELYKIIRRRREEKVGGRARGWVKGGVRGRCGMGMVGGVGRRGEEVEIGEGGRKRRESGKERREVG